MSTPSKHWRGAAVVIGAFLMAGASALVPTGTAYAAPSIGYAAPAPAPEPAPPAAPTAQTEQTAQAPAVAPLPAPVPGPRPNPTPTTQVTAASAGPVHSGPTDSDRVVSNVIRGNQYPAMCWVEGAPVELKGSSERNWVKLRLRRGGVGYVNTVYLKGDSKGNVSAKC